MLIVKYCWGTPVPADVCATKPWSFSSACKNLSRQRPLGAEIPYSPKKVDFSGLESACSTVLLVDQTSTDFSPNAGGIALDLVFPILDIFIRSGDIHDRSLKFSEIDPNFACFWPPAFFGGGGAGPPKFWDLIYYAE